MIHINGPDEWLYDEEDFEDQVNYTDPAQDGGPMDDEDDTYYAWVHNI